MMDGFPISAPAAERGPSWLERLEVFAKAHGGVLLLAGLALSALGLRRRS